MPVPGPSGAFPEQVHSVLGAEGHGCPFFEPASVPGAPVRRATPVLVRPSPVNPAQEPANHECRNDQGYEHELPARIPRQPFEQRHQQQYRDGHETIDPFLALRRFVVRSE